MKIGIKETKLKLLETFYRGTMRKMQKKKKEFWGECNQPFFIPLSFFPFYIFVCVYFILQLLCTKSLAADRRMLHMLTYNTKGDGVIEQ